jgi:hypothetical protein
MSDETELDQDEAVELGQRVEVRSGLSNVVALRVSAELLTRVSNYAKSNGLTVSDVFREGAERVVSGETRVFSVNVTGVRVFGQGIVAGSLTGTTGVSRVLETGLSRSLTGAT